MTHPIRASLATITALMAMILAPAVTPASAQDVVKIGQIEAQTGANAIYGWMSSQGTALAVDEINKAGGFKVGNKTYKLQLIALDTRGEPKEATVQLKRLMTGAQDYYAEHHELPPSAAMTPRLGACCAGAGSFIHGAFTCWWRLPRCC